jgi:hypothetical protein
METALSSNKRLRVDESGSSQQPFCFSGFLVGFQDRSQQPRKPLIEILGTERAEALCTLYPDMHYTGFPQCADMVGQCGLHNGNGDIAASAFTGFMNNIYKI